MMISKRTYSLGFTLIELLVIFSLVAAVSGVGFVSMVAYSRQQALVQSGNNLQQAFNQTRANALSAVKPINCPEESPLSSYKLTVCSKATCITSGVDWEIVAVCGANEVGTNSNSFGEGINVNASETTCTNVSFKALSAAPTGAACKVVIEGFGNKGEIVVDEAGNVSF